MKNSSVLLWFVIAFFTICSSSRIELKNNGYEDILISLPPTLEAGKRPKLITALKNLLQKSSPVLQESTKGRASFHSATFLIPKSWGDIDTWLPRRDNATTLEEAVARLKREEADIEVTNPSKKEHPYTLHHRGCGKQSLRIYLPNNYLASKNIQQMSAEFVRLWSEFRYGVFAEGGFREDTKYPPTFRVPGETEDRLTECVNKPFRIPQECEASGKCDQNLIIPSIMDQHYNNGSFYCEGHSGLGQIHDPHAPTKHNLLCNEEGTYLVVLRSSDFKKGRNAAPRYQKNVEMVFRFVKESTAVNVIVALDTSSLMGLEDRYTLTKNAFSRFVLLDLPNGSILNLFVFSGEENATIVSSNISINGQSSRIAYLESQPLPDAPDEKAYSCPECALNNIIESFQNESGPRHIILVTTQPYINDQMYDNLTKALLQSDIQVHVLLFHKTISSDINQKKSWYFLCKETGNRLISLEGDLLSNLYNGFSSVVQDTSKQVLITQHHLITLDEENLFFPITVDEDLSQSITVSISGPAFETSPLKYDSTELRGPESNMKFPVQKQQLIPAWIFHVPNPRAGVYTLKTWRKRGATSPILITVTGLPKEKNDSITVKLWVENGESELLQPPFEIIAEVKKGHYPVINATVTAYVYHPNNNGVSEINLLDDGLGSTDITKHDGIYSRYFTNFSTPGLYNVYVKVRGGLDDAAAIQKGPSYPCCGSIFPSSEQDLTNEFERQAGPVTFIVTSVPEHDIYPPSKIMDLRIARAYDQMFVLQWTAVGNDYDAGIASAYEMRVFRDRSVIRNRFFDSGLEVYNETIHTTEEASYGTTLFHVLKFPQFPANGLYYAGVRALDDAGNKGEPSNAVALWVETGVSKEHIECEKMPLPLGLNSGKNAHKPISFGYLTLISILNFILLRCISILL